MFSVFESNVTKYGKSLTGTEEEYGADGKTVIQEASTGKYQEIYGNDYKFTATVKECTELTDAEKDAYIKEYKERICPVRHQAKQRQTNSALKIPTKRIHLNQI